MRKFGVVMLAMLTFGLPAMACLSPEDQMTQQERECCKRMAAMCGRGAMPASHSCCKTIIRPGKDAVVEKTQPAIPALDVVIVEDVFDSAQVLAAVAMTSLITPSPPESPPSAIPVLRI